MTGFEDIPKLSHECLVLIVGLYIWKFAQKFLDLCQLIEKSIL